jgi:phage tail P2-like protein
MVVSKMRSLSTVSLADILPPNLVADPFVAALIPVFDEEFRLLVADTAKILLFAALDSQPDEVLDQLAWQFNVDFYDQGAALTVKREMVANALYWHSVKGTPHAVEHVAALALGDSTVEEWFDYGGDPFNFRVITEGAKFPNLAKYTDLVRCIRVVKRASAILERFQIEQSGQQTLTFGGAMQIGQHITLGSA